MNHKEQLSHFAPRCHGSHFTSCLGILLGTVALTANASPAETDFKILNTKATGSGGIEVIYQDPSATGLDYHVLFKGTRVDQIETPVALSLEALNNSLADTNSPTPGINTFYRVARYSKSAPNDSDHDGLPDLYELSHTPAFNPLNPQDGQADPDHDGRSNAWESYWGTNPTQWDIRSHHTIGNATFAAGMIKNNGTLWGIRSRELGYSPDFGSLELPSQVTGYNDWIDVKGESTGVAAVRSQGGLYYWGTLPTTRPAEGGDEAARVATDSDWASVIPTSTGVFAIKKNGSLWAWGDNIGGNLGLPAGEFGDFEREIKTPRRIGSDNDWVTVSTRAGSHAGLKKDGSLWVWGNYVGRSGAYSILEPRQLGTDKDWVSAVPAIGVVAVKSNGTLWGIAHSLSDETILNQPAIQLGTDSDWVDVAYDPRRVFFLKSNGSLWAHPMGATEISPIWNKTDWVELSSSLIFGPMARTRSGELWSWESPYTAWAGAVTRSDLTQIGTSTDWASVDRFSAMQKDHSVWTWGGDIDLSFTWEPNPITGLNAPFKVEHSPAWRSISLGLVHALAIDEQNDLFSWGWDGNGALGQGPLKHQSYPVQASPGTKWRKAQGGMHHSVAIKTDGTLWTWGASTAFQVLGEFNNIITRPQQIGTDSDWADISPGYDHSLAIKQDGSLWGWGNNNRRQLGVATPAVAFDPVRIGSSTDWAKSAAGKYFSLALKNDGSLWFFGMSQTPIAVYPGTFWKDIEAGLGAVGIQSDGTLWAGLDSLFADPSSGTLSWSKIAPGTKWTSASLSWKTPVAATAVQSNGTLWTWGNNYFGGLARPDAHYPLKLGSESDWGIALP